MAEFIIKGNTVLVDDEDMHIVKRHSWFMTRAGYVCTSVRVGVNKRRTMGLHRVILGDPPTPAIDHVNRNKLDNRKSNLVACTDSENSRNRDFTTTRRGKTSKYWGVSQNRSGRWQVVVKVDGKAVHFGVFLTEIESAAKAKEVFHGIYGQDATYELFPKPPVTKMNTREERRNAKSLGMGI